MTSSIFSPKVKARLRNMEKAAEMCERRAWVLLARAKNLREGAVSIAKQTKKMEAK